ncbi:hypothetical protein FRC17_005443 [Serendipita sp. 399]|nr:hypothetical protein FRC17_005443 [Serendipita sp. 399]
MPYLSPSSSQTSTTVDPEETPRLSHRRTRSATPTFSTETGPGAFTPLTGLPRRQRQFEKRTLFQIAPDDEDEQESAPSIPNGKPPSPPLEPPRAPETRFSVSETPATPPVSDIPFPSSSDAAVPFPSLETPATPTSRSTSISRSGSTPVVLANGKPLKPSLKSSLSSPHIGDWRAQHPRSKSEPTTPSGTKSVHFPEKKDSLESVVVFEKTARPRAVSGNADDTETETEGYDSPAIAGIFQNQSFSSVDNSQQLGIEIDPDVSSPVPAREPALFSNVHFETLVFPRMRPPTLRGSILVKNVAFEKSVAIRFTLDNWQTTSEVVCQYVCSLPSLPSPFPPDRVTPSSPPLSWDRFSFVIRLEDVERKLAERTIFLVARFSASGVGEWWDNNGGSNYKLSFKKVALSSPPVPKKGPSPLRNSDGPKRMFPGLDLRPSAMTLPSSDPSIPPLKLKKPFSSSGTTTPPKSSPSAPTTSNINAVSPPPPPNAANNALSNAQNNIHQRSTSSSSIASGSSSGSLRLTNYAPPSSPVTLVNAPSQRILMGPIIGGQPVSPPPAPAEPATLPVPIPGVGKRRSPIPSLTSTITSPISAEPPATPGTPEPAEKTPPANSSYVANRMSYPFVPTDSSYATLVEKWCFHQSPAPGANDTPASEASTPGLGPGTTSVSPGAAFESPASGFGSGYGYGHHILGRPLTLKP